MPSIKNLRDIAIPVVVEHGNEKITLQAGLERKSTQAEAFAKLIEQENEIGLQISLVVDEKNALVNRNAMLRVPETGDVLEFREKMSNCVKDITALLAEIDGAPAAPDSITLARDSAQEAFDSIEDWTAALLLTPEQVKEGTDKAIAQAKDLTAKTEALRQQLHQNHAAQVALVCLGWDLTEDDSEESPVWPLTPENIATFSPALVKKMYDATVKNV